MGALAGNQNSAGHVVATKSVMGRKPAWEEKKLAELVDKCRGYLLENWNNFDDKQKLDISLKIVIKTAPQDIDITSLGEKIMPVPILGYVPNNNGDTQNSVNDQTT